MYLEINLSNSCTERTQYFHGTRQSWGLFQTPTTWENTRSFYSNSKIIFENPALVLPFCLLCSEVKRLTSKANLKKFPVQTLNVQWLDWFKFFSTTRHSLLIFCTGSQLIFYCKERTGIFVISYLILYRKGKSRVPSPDNPSGRHSIVQTLRYSNYYVPASSQ